MFRTSGSRCAGQNGRDLLARRTLSAGSSGHDRDKGQSGQKALKRLAASAIERPYVGCFNGPGSVKLLGYEWPSLATLHPMTWRTIWGCIGKTNWAASPVRATLFQKVASVLGPFRAVTNTYGVAGYWRASWRNARSSGLGRGWVLATPC